MAIKCGNCGKSHATVAAVRACHDETSTARIIDMQLPRARHDRPRTPLPIEQIMDNMITASHNRTRAARTPPPAEQEAEPQSKSSEQAAEPQPDPPTAHRAAAQPNPSGAARWAGPDRLGRSVLVEPGQPVPEPWARTPRVTVDFTALADTESLVDRLQRAWIRRERLVIELGAELPDDPPATGPLWKLGPDFELTGERLRHLVFANSVDARPGAAHSWPLARAAIDAGARLAPDGPADVVLPDGTPAFCDGGPLEPIPAEKLVAPSPAQPGSTQQPADEGTSAEESRAPGAAVVPAIALERGSLARLGTDPPNAELAPDQLAAVAHRRGGARIIAPAGSGKTRVLTERARHLLRERGLPPGAVTLVAFNVRARAEMEERTADLPGLQIRTLNSLALAIVNGAGPFRRPHGREQSVATIAEPEVRDILDGLIPRQRRRAMSDRLAPWLDALTAARLGLRNPAEVQSAFAGEVEGFPQVFDAYRRELRSNGQVDYDEQILAAIETLLADPEARRAAQRACRVLLVDEFQDLTPAHLLLVRLLSAPAYDLYGVGDDDQTIYGFASASPAWLIDFAWFVPGSGSHGLEINYRCPPSAVEAAANLLSHNHRRVPKQIRARPGRAAEPGELAVAEADNPTAACADRVAELVGAGAAPEEIAVLSRVNVTLLGPQLELAHRRIPVEATVGPALFDRTGVAAALAWLRLAAAGGTGFDGRDIEATARRPPRGIRPLFVEWMSDQATLGGLRRLANRLNEPKDQQRVRDYADDVERLVEAARSGATTADLLAIVRDRIGLGRALAALDSSGRGASRSAHSDDLAALLDAARLHPDPEDFAPWLRSQLAAGRGGRDGRGGRGGGDRRSSSERGGDESNGEGGGSGQREGESGSDGGGRGVHLATVHRVKGQEWPHIVVYDASDGLFPHSLAEDVEEERRLFHVAVTRCSSTVTVVADSHRPSPFINELTEPRPPEETEAEPPVDWSSPKPSARRDAPTRSVAAAAEEVKADEAIVEALRTWRLERARSDGVPAYVVFDNKTMTAIAAAEPQTLGQLAAVPGIGPSRLESYGDEILAAVASVIDRRHP